MAIKMDKRPPLEKLEELVKYFHRNWEANINNLNDIPYDMVSGVGLPFFKEALKYIRQLKKETKHGWGCFLKEKRKDRAVAVTLCDFGDALRKDELHYHFSVDAAKKAYNRIRSIYHGIHGWRVWQEILSDHTVINDTNKELK